MQDVRPNPKLMSRSRKASPLPITRPRVQKSAWGRSVWEAPRFSSDRRRQKSNFSPACEKTSAWIWFMWLLPSLTSRSFVLPHTLSGISCGYRAVKLACAAYEKGGLFPFPARHRSHYSNGWGHEDVLNLWWHAKHSESLIRRMWKDVRLIYHAAVWLAVIFVLGPMLSCPLHSLWGPWRLVWIRPLRSLLQISAPLYWKLADRNQTTTCNRGGTVGSVVATGNHRKQNMHNFLRKG